MICFVLIGKLDCVFFFLFSGPEMSSAPPGTQLRLFEALIFSAGGMILGDEFVLN